ncbi:MAG: hypothetical protein N2505_07160, partial [Endomicrobia bacterium]|nr:hypothetical protein [Endomicrobiia bacterium]
WRVYSSGVWLFSPYDTDLKVDLRSFVTSPYIGVIYDLTKDNLKISPCVFVGYAFGELKGNFKNYTKFGNSLTNYTKDVNFSFGYRIANITEFKYKKDVDINNDGTITEDVDLIKGKPVKDKETSDVVQFNYTGLFLTLGITYRF